MSKEKTQSLTRKGSILAYSLIIIATMLAIAGSLSVATVIEKKGASSTEFSMQSLQTADSGVQLALKKINVALSKSTPGTLTTALGALCGGTNDGPGDSLYELKFSDESGTELGCGDDVSKVRNIKSIGTYRNTVRAVEVAVAGSAEEPYQTDCFFLGGYQNCCQIETTTGITSCKVLSAGTWLSYTNKPWGTASTGNFRISCYASGGSATTCCRSNASSGSTQCLSVAGSGNPWGSSNQPF